LRSVWSGRGCRGRSGPGGCPSGSASCSTPPDTPDQETVSILYNVLVNRSTHWYVLAD
jgi:hypothetical protein